MPAFVTQDAVALVTGTNKPNGIGRAIVEALVQHGAAKVYATARTTSQLDELVAKHKGKVIAVGLDVTDLNAISQLSKSYPDVTLIVNNAGYGAYNSTIGNVDEALAEIQINYMAPLAIGKAYASQFVDEKATPSGDPKRTAIVNISSIAGFSNFPFSATYSASKAATNSLIQAQRRDFPHSLVVGVYPGPIETDMSKGVELDKAPPSAVADAVLDALEHGHEDVFPDPISQQMYERWKIDAKAFETYVTENFMGTYNKH